MKPTMMSLAIVLAAITACGRAESSKTKFEGVGLNAYCDPIDTIYLGSSPLFDENTGVTLTLEQYLDGKGLNEYCDPIGTMYEGGNPLFDENTGETLTREEYLSRKPYVRH